MSRATAESAHEIGRTGVVRAKTLLWQVLGEAIDLPFTAYDHGPKLTFRDPESPGFGSFNFDLKGVLRRRDSARISDHEAVEVLVEVKATRAADSLLGEYREFVRRAAVVASEDAHKDTWFIFVVQVPFGCSYGSSLCDGALLEECRLFWPKSFERTPAGLSDRIAIVVATESLRRLIDHWKPR